MMREPISPFPVTRGLPIPRKKSGRPHGPLSKTVQSLNPGESVILPLERHGTARSAACRARKRTGFKYVVRSSGEWVGVWRVA